MERLEADLDHLERQAGIHTSRQMVPYLPVRYGTYATKLYVPIPCTGKIRDRIFLCRYPYPVLLVHWKIGTWYLPYLTHLGPHLH